MQLIHAIDYPAALVRSIEKAEHRVVLFSHIIAADETTEALMNALCDAAKRGVSVEMAGDVFTFTILAGVSLGRNNPIKQLRSTIKRLKKSGVKYQWVGQFGPVLFAGRCHVKWCIVDSEVYGFGGANLYRKGIATADYMMHGEDTELADALIAEHRKILISDRSGKFYKSHSFECAIGTVHLDGGIPNDSAIYRRACELAEQAAEITFVSQYCPTGKLAKIMARKQAKLYFSGWRVADGLNRIFIRLTMQLTGYKTLYTRGTYIHAKFMIFRMPDGSQVALTGSHNFVRSGVVLGTREITLETRDTTTITELQYFFENHIL